MKKAPRRQAIALPFYKLHAAGNDMLVFLSKNLPLAGRKKREFVQKIAHRNLGLGSDQVLEVLSTKPLAIQIWNCDGSKAEMCANGARAILFLAAKLKWISTKLKEVPLEVSGGKYLGLRREDSFELCLGAPKILGEKQLQLGTENVPYLEVSVGNPHAVIFSTGSPEMRPWCPKEFDYKKFGPAIECHPDFPQKTNVEFIRSWKATKSQVEVQVEAWERGAGATLSCGSGAVAVAAVMRKFLGASLVKVRMTDFVLEVRFDEKNRAYLSGPCAFVASGTYFS